MSREAPPYPERVVTTAFYGFPLADFLPYSVTELGTFNSESFGSPLLGWRRVSLSRRSIAEYCVGGLCICGLKASSKFLPPW